MFYQTTIFLMLIILKFQIKFNKKNKELISGYQKGFKELINRILLQKDKKKLSNLN